MARVWRHHHYARARVVALNTRILKDFRDLLVTTTNGSSVLAGAVYRLPDDCVFHARISSIGREPLTGIYNIYEASIGGQVIAGVAIGSAKNVIINVTGAGLSSATTDYDFSGPILTVTQKGVNNKTIDWWTRLEIDWAK